MHVLLIMQSQITFPKFQCHHIFYFAKPQSKDEMSYFLSIMRLNSDHKKEEANRLTNEKNEKKRKNKKQLMKKWKKKKNKQKLKK